MSAPGAAKVATGDFYRIDQFGNGQVGIYRLPNGSYALRLENFPNDWSWEHAYWSDLKVVSE